ncbi:MAG TPA: hypothetical protein VJM08_13645 [Anaerolineales bacterium]|nr:hypothetical protein [Anaerolineales bacterium]
MKRFVHIAVLISLLSGCSSLPISIPFLQSPTPTSPPAPTATPFALPASNTPDLFVINTSSPTSTAEGDTALGTDTPIPFTPTFRATITLEPISPNLFTPSPNIFLSVQKSTTQLVWGSTCEGARSIRFTVQVTPVRRLRFVTLWYRLQDKYSGRNTGWGGGAIFSDNDQGTYFYDLQLNQITGYRFYEDAWFQYQLVASTVTRRVLGRSVVSQNEISLTHCKVFNP